MTCFRKGEVVAVRAYRSTSSIRDGVVLDQSEPSEGRRLIQILRRRLVIAVV